MIELPADYDKLTPSQRKEVRIRYIALQNNLCFYCKHSLDDEPPKSISDKQINWNLFPPNFLKNPIHLQHDHYTGMTEGAVHAYCNAVMWQYEGR